MYDVICVGTTTIDFYFKGPALPEVGGKFELTIGSKYYTDFFHEQIGGGATNVSIGCAKLGLRPALVAQIGNNEFKRVIFEKLDMHGVSYRFTHLVDEYRNFSCILTSHDGEKTVINYRTKNAKLFHATLPQEIFRHARVMYMGNVAEATESSRAKLLRQAKENGLTTVTTLGKVDCTRPHTQIDDILGATDVLLINTDEFALLARRARSEVNFRKNVHEQFPDLHLPATVVLTDGKDGSYGYAEGKVFFQEAIRPKHIVDTTGAGDGFAAGFIAKYLKSKDVAAAMLSGAQYAAVKLSHLGAN